MRLQVPAGISARHIHLDEDTLIQLFGENAPLNIRNPLRQPGAFASELTVELFNEHHCFSNVRVLGPCKSHNQIEISHSDAYHLQLDVPVNKSQDFTGSPGLYVRTDHATLLLEQCVIIPQRHLHISTVAAAHYGWIEDQCVAIQVGGIKGGILDNVHIRTGAHFVSELHLDLDDANAFQIAQGQILTIMDSHTSTI